VKVGVERQGVLKSLLERVRFSVKLVHQVLLQVP
jgi:hypothetical protein